MFSKLANGYITETVSKCKNCFNLINNRSVKTIIIIIHRKGFSAICDKGSRVKMCESLPEALGYRQPLTRKPTISDPFDFIIRGLPDAGLRSLKVLTISRPQPMMHPLAEPSRRYDRLQSGNDSSRFSRPAGFGMPFNSPGRTTPYLIPYLFTFYMVIKTLTCYLFFDFINKFFERMN
jgi:hypothetical protein